MTKKEMDELLAPGPHPSCIVSMQDDLPPDVPLPFGSYTKFVAMSLAHFHEEVLQDVAQEVKRMLMYLPVGSVTLLIIPNK